MKNTQTKKHSRTDKLRSIHHSAPQGYLKRFSIYEKPNYVFAYETNKEPYIASVKNVAAQRDLYTFTDAEGETAELEDAFADIDARGLELLHLLDTMSDGYIELPESGKADLYSYVAFLHTRNVQERKHWAESYGQMSLVQLQMVASNKNIYHVDAKKALGKDYNFKRAESTRTALLEGKLKVEYNPMDQYFLGATLEISKELYRVLMTMKRAVLVSTGTPSKHFITSDNPVTHFTPENYVSKRLGLGYINAAFQLPISPTRCLLLLNDDMKMRTFECDRGAVDHMNFYTCHYADRWVFSHINSKTISKMFSKHKAKGPQSIIDSPFDRAQRRKDKNAS